MLLVYTEAEKPESRDRAHRRLLGINRVRSLSLSVRRVLSV